MCWGEKEMRVCPHDGLIDEQPIRWIDCQHGSLTLGSCKDRFIHVASVNRLCIACQAEVDFVRNNGDVHIYPPHRPLNRNEMPTHSTSERMAIEAGALTPPVLQASTSDYETPDMFESESGPAEELPSYEETMTDPSPPIHELAHPVLHSLEHPEQAYHAAYDQSMAFTEAMNGVLGPIYEAITHVHEVINSSPTALDARRRLHTLVYIKSLVLKLQPSYIARYRTAMSLVKQRDVIYKQDEGYPHRITDDSKARIEHINCELREIYARSNGYTDGTDFAGGGTAKQMVLRLHRFVSHVVLNLKPVQPGRFHADPVDKEQDVTVSQSS